tara:strand:- start:6050 stop:6841 length:792 start_codon:yes stop_codon:yes gene_type:complete
MSQITVTNIQGQTSGGNANKVIITSGHTLEVTSNSTVGGNSTITGSLTAPDIRATAIKSSSGNSAMTIASGGQVTFATNPAGITAGSMIKLLDTTVSSVGGNYDIDNTYINSTYDSYKIIYNVKPDTDNVDLRLQFFMTTNASGDAGSIISGNNHSYQNGSFLGTYRNSNTSSYSVIGHVNIGNATGEGINIEGTLMNVNDTSMLVALTGTASLVATNGAHNGFAFHAGMATPATYGAYYCRGLRFYMGAGQHTGRVKLFGIT